MFEREERTPISVVFYSVYLSVYLVFLVLSFRGGASKAIKPFVERSHKSVWEWYQEFGRDKKRFQSMFRLHKERE